jgi:hypothetical protein
VKKIIMASIRNNGENIISGIEMAAWRNGGVKYQRRSIEMAAA